MATQMALNTFYGSISTIASKMIAVNCFAPDSLIAAITPLIHTAGSNPWTNHNFVGGDIAIQGLLGNTSSKYLDTGCNPASIYPNDNGCGFTLYSASTGSALSARMNAYNGSTMAGLYQDSSSSYTGAYQAWDTSFVISALFPAGTFGFTSANRTASNAVAIYRANSLTAFAAGSSAGGAPGGRPNLNLWMNCWNFNGSPSQFPVSATRYSFAAIHLGLTSGEAQTLYNAVQALRITLGGGYT
jgi:hypothetical protein